MTSGSAPMAEAWAGERPIRAARVRDYGSSKLPQSSLGFVMACPDAARDNGSSPVTGYRRSLAIMEIWLRNPGYRRLLQPPPWLCPRR